MALQQNRRSKTYQQKIWRQLLDKGDNFIWKSIRTNGLDEQIKVLPATCISELFLVGGSKSKACNFGGTCSQIMFKFCVERPLKNLLQATDWFLARVFTLAAPDQRLLV